VNRSPAFQLYPDKALAGTMHLSDAAFAAYWKTVFFMWLNSDQHCTLVNEKTAICAASGLSPRRYDKVWRGEVMAEWRPMFRIEGNHLVCNGLRKEVEKQRVFRERASKGGQAKAKQTPSNAQAVLNECIPSPITSPTTYNPPTPQVDDGAGFTPGPPAPVHPSAPMLLKQWCAKAGWVGKLDSPRRHIDGAIAEFGDGRVSGAITQSVKGEKPWELLDRLRGRKPGGKQQPSGPRVAEYDPGPELTPAEKAAAAKAAAKAMAEVKAAFDGKPAGDDVPF